MFQRILVPLDGSARAERAIPIAARIAWMSNGSVYLLQVRALPTDYTGGLSPAPQVTKATIEEGKHEATQYLQQIAASPPLTKITTTTDVLFGFPADEILAAAESRNIDLIVLCSHGRTGFTRWVLGSVASTLIQESAVPTLVLREQEPLWTFPDPSRTQPLRALVPLDGSPLAEAALAPAAHLIAALAAPAPAALHLVQVVAPSQETGEKREGHDIQEAQTTAYLAKVAEHLQITAKYLHLTITWSVFHERDVADALANLAEHGQEGQHVTSPGPCDLIALSTHGRGGFARWVMGSVAQRLLTATTLPLLVMIRPPQRTIHHAPRTSGEGVSHVGS